MDVNKPYIAGRTNNLGIIKPRTNLNNAVDRANNEFHFNPLLITPFFSKLLLIICFAAYLIEYTSY